MKLTKKDLESPRRLNSRKVKENILSSVNKLMNSYGYEYLTIRNICKMANISTGTFYHHFKNKDEVMSFFVSKGYEQYKKKRQEKSNNFQPHEKIIDLLTWMSWYYSEMGLDFVSNYFSGKNKILNVRDFSNLTRYHKEIIMDLLSYLEKAQNEKIIVSDIQKEEIYNELNIIFFGTVFDWCLCEGKYLLTNKMERMLRIHFNNYLEDGYKFT